MIVSMIAGIKWKGTWGTFYDDEIVQYFNRGVSYMNVYTLAKIYWTAYLRAGHCTICKLYLNLKKNNDSNMSILWYIELKNF